MASFWDMLSAAGNGLMQAPSWLDQATQQMKQNAAAYQQGGVPALMANTQPTQDLAGAFAGTIGNRLSPALKIMGGVNDGAIVRGVPGQIHADLLDKAYPLMGRSPNTGRFLADVQNGFVADNGQYFTRLEAARYFDNPAMAHSANLK